MIFPSEWVNERFHACVIEKLVPVEAQSWFIHFADEPMGLPFINIVDSSREHCFDAIALSVDPGVRVAVGQDNAFFYLDIWPSLPVDNAAFCKNRLHGP